MAASTGDLVIRYSGPSVDEFEISLDDFVDTHLERLQSRFLERLSRVSDFLIDSGRAKDADEHFSEPAFRWISSELFEASLFFQLPQLMDCLRLDALEDILEAEKYSELRAIGLPKAVMRVLGPNSGEAGSLPHNLVAEFLDYGAKVLGNLRSIVWLLLFYFQAGAKRFLTRSVEPVTLRNRVLLFSHHQTIGGSLSDYTSRFWGGLVGAIKDSGRNPLLVILPSQSSLLSGQRDDILNRKLGSVVIEGAGEIDAVWLDSFGGLFPANPLRYILAERRHESHVASAFEMVFPEWQSILLRRIFWGENWVRRVGVWMHRINFENFLGSVGPDNSAIVLSEGNSWENVLVFLWKLKPRKNISAYVHTPIRLGDLRMGLRKFGTWGANGRLKLFDYFLSISVANRNFFLGQGIPESQIIDTYPWRYSFLKDIVSDPGTSGAKKVLLLGDSEPGLDREFASLCMFLQDRVGPQIDIRYRPHPSATGESLGKPEIRDLLSTESLAADLNWASVAVCGPSSTASFDAVEAGLTTVVFSPNHRIRTIAKIARSKAHFAHSFDGVLSLLENLETTTGAPSRDLNFNLPEGLLATGLERVDSWPETETLR